jgi:hypothetical protein
MLMRAASQTMARRRPAEMVRTPRMWWGSGVIVLLV